MIEEESKYCKICVQEEDNPRKMELSPWPSSKHVITNETPSKLLNGRGFRTPLELLRPNSKKFVELKQGSQMVNFRGGWKQNFQVNDVVMAKDFRKDHPNFSQAQIVSKLSPRICIVEFCGGGRAKRHYDQLISWRKNDQVPNEIVSENDDSRLELRRSSREKKPVERYVSTRK
ncbi:hypothetical protein QAD02_007147 [Eretmocerus hayati]|uniref:Uncharacterized protein n=1 Tax=Eretmocerus hayati TaxID=131215 RepID=A0ACC2N2V1_9HYME|nr:hypothetical protein QAD02_007147 [Eretmocerus hayati]